MTKNITVVDENGIIVGSTYPKRASGLVKKGRAHWIDKDKVCLCAHNMEENKMPDKIYDVIDNQFSKLQEKFSSIPNADKISMNMIDSLTTMQMRNRELDIVEKQLNVLNDMMAKESAAADEKTVRAREATKQKMLDVLSKVLDEKREPEASVEYSIFSETDEDASKSASENKSADSTAE